MSDLNVLNEIFLFQQRYMETLSKHDVVIVTMLRNQPYPSGLSSMYLKLITEDSK